MEKSLQKDLVKIIQNFILKLYQKHDIERTKQKLFWGKYFKMELKDEQKELLNKPITTCEIVEAIKKQKITKHQDLSLPAELYKTFEDILL